MNVIFEFRKPEKSDKRDFIALSTDFYASDAVICPVPAKFHERAFDELMSSDRYIEFFLFIGDGKTAGYALIAKSYSREAGGAVVWVDELYLKPDYRGRGAAKQFFAFLEKRYAAARFRLEVEDDNERAKRLYEKLGYRYLPYVQMIKGN